MLPPVGDQCETHMFVKLVFSHSSVAKAPWSLLGFALALCEPVNSQAVLNSHTGLWGQRLAGFLHVQTLADQVEAAHGGHQEHEEAWRRDRKS